MEGTRFTVLRRSYTGRYDVPIHHSPTFADAVRFLRGYNPRTHKIVKRERAYPFTVVAWYDADGVGRSNLERRDMTFWELIEHLQAEHPWIEELEGRDWKLSEVHDRYHATDVDPWGMLTAEEREYWRNNGKG